VDPVTHLTAGALGGRLTEYRFGKKQLFWFCVGAAWLPDIDNLFGLLGPEFYLLHHRGITHSFIGGLMLALLFAGVFRLFSKTFPFVSGLLVAYACIVLHIFLDLITSYGTLIFSPLTRERFTLNSVFIIDPIFTGAMMLLLLSTRVWRNRAKQIAIAGLGWIILYPMLSFGVNRAVTRYYSGRLDNEGIPYQRLELSTEPFSPFLWKLVLEHEGHYSLAGVNVFDLDRELRFEFHSKPNPELTGALVQQISMLKTFLWFARYPVMEYEHVPGGGRLLFNDLRFFSTVGFLQRSIRNNNSAPFSLVIDLDTDNTPLSWRYRRPRGTVVIHYIE